MKKLTAGVLAGLVLGVLHGIWIASGDVGAASLAGVLLGRASQGIINGILTAWLAGGRMPAWRAAVWGALFGVLLGALRGIAHQAWMTTIPPSAVVGLGCGLAVSLARRD